MTSRFGHLSFAALAAVLLGAVAATAADPPRTNYGGPLFGDVIVAVEPLPIPSNVAAIGRGYTEFRIRLTNQSATDEHDVALIYPAPEYQESYDHIARITRRVRLARGSTMTIPLLQPALEVAGRDLAVEVDGKRFDWTVNMPPAPPRQMYYGPWRHVYGPTPGSGCVAILASRAVPETFRDSVEKRHSEVYGFFRSKLPVQNWSDNWLGYGCYCGVLLTEQEAGELPAPVLLALRRYVECGGVVIVYGGSAPKELTEGGWEPPGGKEHAVGLGVVVVTRTNDEAAGWEKLADGWADIPLAASLLTTGGGGDDVLISQKLRVPLRGLFVVVLVFAVGIGPVNLYLLSRRGNRMWLWWNVPAISVVTCLGIFAYSIVSEGFTGRMRASTLTVLDENSHRAATIGYLSLYSPFTPSGGLRFGYQTEVTAIPRDVYDQAGRARTVDWTDCQQLDSGWIVARAPANFLLRRNEDRRERINVHGESDGSLKAVNALGVNVKRLYLRVSPQPRNAGVGGPGSAGGMYYLSDLPAGGEGRLEILQGHDKPPPSPEVMRQFFTDNWSVALRQLREQPADFVMPGCYVAICERSPFTDTPLPGAMDEEGTAVVYGISAWQARPAGGGGDDSVSRSGGDGS